MKQKYKAIIKVVVVLVIGFWVLSIIPFNRKIKQEISANIYINGVVSDETSVFIDGEKSNYLFHDNESFYGNFHVLSYKKTGRDGMSAQIAWKNDEHIQRLRYYYKGTFPSMDIISTLIINEKMTQFALMFTDGTVIATSDELYKIYTQHISYNPDTGITSIKAINKIPKIK
ncbi:hypothetical protein EDC19_1563 [Natranaerovirga hydrolytica]|uniref:Uncharacterized protein n=1 Tax=Natranaerovirga hydrolytica TaxID=680378 RepID=A0A4R1MMM7_9FIRM|nr:hypothetical protein [Natranaerovirga hydrolytica]TCK93370.1 hypothetical protein EDC19_1563 [Natranaerovirga hydrolytica]